MVLVGKDVPVPMPFPGRLHRERVTLLAAAQSIRRLAALDGDARQMSELFNLALLLRSGAAGLARIDRERPQHLSFRGADRSGPAGAEPMGQGERPIFRPAFVRSKVGGDHLLVAIGSSAAGTHAESDRETIDSRYVAVGEA